MGGRFRDCEGCEAQFGPRGIVRLSHDNQEAWERYDLIHHLGVELATALDPLDLGEDEAWVLAQRFRLIAEMHRLQTSRLQGSAIGDGAGCGAFGSPNPGLIRREALMGR
ncbi:MAG: hypothetical protein HYY96_01275 [Candidatus Tectomicrobia bacterium]|nr:hypothetical protein [Candidatus Tectomicrobia bacterium]